MLVNFTIAPLREVGPAHGALTYPIYAKQLAERLAGRDWVAFEARAGGELVGLIIAINRRSRAELLSVAVAKSHRRQGVASRLLETLRKSLLDAGAKELTVAFRHDLANAGVVDALLVRNGWSEPQTNTEIGSIWTGELAGRLEKYAARYPVGFGAQVAAWRDATLALRSELEAESETWYPRGLAPSRFPIDREDTTSSVVLAGGRIIAWMLVRVEKMDPPQMDFCCAYVHPIWKRRGTLMWLVARCVREVNAQITHGLASWKVSDERPETKRFYQRRLSAFGVRFGRMTTSHAPGFPMAERVP